MLITNDLDQLMQKVDLQGWGTFTLDQTLLNQLLIRFNEIESLNQLRPALITQSTEVDSSLAIRNDFIHWLSFDQPAECELESLLQKLQLHLKNYFRISLTHFECHFALYPAGHFYKTHIDQTQHDNKRFFTFVIYLNPSWEVENGGQIVGYEDFSEKSKLFEILPTAGTVIIFQSHIPHEVKISNKTRRSITGWFRT